MRKLLTLAEAATFLGVSKDTLRNWDNQGKLAAQRHPKNNYRAYFRRDLEKLKESHQEVFELDVSFNDSKKPTEMDTGKFMRVLNVLHNAVRDADGNSSIMERFDEIAKLLFIKIFCDSRGINWGNTSSLVGPPLVERFQFLYDECIQKANLTIPEKFAKIKLGFDALEACVELLQDLDFSDLSIDAKGHAYQEVIRGTFEVGDNQQFFTPPEIVRFMVEVLLTVQSPRVAADPACGTGGFLAELLRRGSLEKAVGLEVDERLAWAAALNLSAMGSSTPVFTTCLSEGGSLGVHSEQFHNAFDAILTNPPFGSDTTDSAILSSFKLGSTFKSRRRGILFLEKCHSLLKPNGLLGIVIDDGVLSQSSTSDVREFIRTNFKILAIVSLPDTAFQPYASVNTSILFLQKSKEPLSSRIFFARSSKIGKKANGEPLYRYDQKGNQELDSDLHEIALAWRTFYSGTTFKEDDQTFVVNNFEETAIGHRLDILYNNPARRNAEKFLESSQWKIATISEICAEVIESVIPNQDFDGAFLPFTGLAEIEANTGRAVQRLVPAQSLKSSVKRTTKGDIVFSKMRPELRKTFLNEFDEVGYVSAECIVLRPITGREGIPFIKPELLAALIRSDVVMGQLLHKQVGIGRPRVSGKDLKACKIPIPPQNVQERIYAHYLGEIQAAEKLLAESKRLEKQSINLRNEANNGLAKAAC